MQSFRVITSSIFLGADRNMRDQYRDSDNFKRTARFVAKYDDPAFDPSVPILSLSLFESALRRVLAEPINSIYKEAMANSK